MSEKKKEEAQSPPKNWAPAPEAAEAAAREYAALTKRIGELNRRRDVLKAELLDALRARDAEGMFGAWGEVYLKPTIGMVDWEQLAREFSLVMITSEIEGEYRKPGKMFNVRIFKEEAKKGKET